MNPVAMSSFLRASSVTIFAAAARSAGVGSESSRSLSAGKSCAPSSGIRSGLGGTSLAISYACFAAAASVSAEGDDRVRALRNRLEEGNWLLLVETANGVEMPWTRLQEARPKAVVRLNEG